MTVRAIKRPAAEFLELDETMLPGTVSPLEAAILETQIHWREEMERKSAWRRTTEQQAAQRIVGAVNHGLNLNGDRLDADTGEAIFGTGKP